MDWLLGVLVMTGIVGGVLYAVELVGRLLLVVFRAIQDRRNPRFRPISDVAR